MIDMQEPVALTFALRYLNSFAKATPLSPSVRAVAQVPSADWRAAQALRFMSGMERLLKLCASANRHWSHAACRRSAEPARMIINIRVQIRFAAPPGDAVHVQGVASGGGVPHQRHRPHFVRTPPDWSPRHHLALCLQRSFLELVDGSVRSCVARGGPRCNVSCLLPLVLDDGAHAGNAMRVRSVACRAPAGSTWRRRSRTRRWMTTTSECPRRTGGGGGGGGGMPRSRWTRCCRAACWCCCGLMQSRRAMRGACKRCWELRRLRLGPLRPRQWCLPFTVARTCRMVEPH